jgi:titin
MGRDSGMRRFSDGKGGCGRATGPERRIGDRPRPRDRRIRPTLLDLEERRLLATFTVTSTADSGAGSLRQAIVDADQSSGASLITFDVASSGSRQTIAPDSALPEIDAPVVIDGLTQGGPGYTGAPLISIRGDDAGRGANGMVLDAGSDGSTIEGLEIEDFGAAGIVVASSGNTVGYATSGGGDVISGNGGDGILITGSGNLVEGDFLGTEADGTTGDGNGGNGVEIQGSTLGGRDTIGGLAGAGDVISDNGGDGILIAGADDLVEGDFIGTNADGSLTIGNGGNGIEIPGPSSNTSNTIGGLAGAVDVISGNQGDGVLITSPGNLVEGDFIGTNPDGSAAIPNIGYGVEIQGSTLGGENTIGGRSGVGDVISGNEDAGIFIASDGNLVEGDFIGTNAGGTASINNSTDGVDIQGAANTLGGTSAGVRNVISGNIGGSGVDITTVAASDNVVEGNFIGTDVTGKSALGNQTDVTISSQASGNTIGGATATPGLGAGNVISGVSSGGGIAIAESAFGNFVRGNLIGTDESGESPIGDFNGISIFEAEENVIGGDAAGDANVISGNTEAGIAIAGAFAYGNLVEGNVLGLSRDGSRVVLPPDPAIGLLPEGILIAGAPNNTIGGAGAGNVITGFSIGVDIAGSGASDNTVVGDRFGTDPLGDARPGSIGIGVYLEDAAYDTVGGTSPGAGNVILGYSYYGIFIYDAPSTSDVVQGNRIGAGVPSRKGPLVGIAVENASGNTLGGLTASAANTISGNYYAGIYVFGQGNAGTPGNVIAQNVLDRDAYGILLYNDTIDGSYPTLAGRNRFVHSGIANVREFSGPVTSGGGSSPAATSRVLKRVDGFASQSRPVQRPRGRPARRGIGVPLGPLGHRRFARLNHPPAAGAHAGRGSGRTAS